MSPPIVLLVSNEAEFIGGGEFSLSLLLEGLHHRDDVLALLAVPAEGAVAARGRELGVEVVELPLPPLRRRPWRWPSTLRSTRRLLRRLEVGVVHCNGTRAMAVAGLAARREGVPVVWHVRVTGYDPFDRWLAPAADRVVTPSRAVGSRFGERVVRVVENPVRPVAVERRESDRQRLRAVLAPRDERILLVVGQITPSKRQLETVEAVVAADPDGEWRLLLAGTEDTLHEGYLRSVLERAEALHIGERVAYLGSRDDIAAVMAASDLLLHLPEAEGFGRVFIEAMAVGLPVLVTPVGGLAELHASTGYGRLTEGTTVEDLVAGIEKALADGKAMATAAAIGPAMVVERFSPDGHAAAVAGIYHELLEGERS